MPVRIAALLVAFLAVEAAASAAPRTITKHTNCTVTSIESQGGEYAGSIPNLFLTTPDWLYAFRSKVSATCDDGSIEFWTAQTAENEKAMPAHLYGSLTQGKKFKVISTASTTNTLPACSTDPRAVDPCSEFLSAWGFTANMVLTYNTLFGWKI